MLKSITGAFISLITFHSLCLNYGAHISERPSCYFKAAEEELAGRLLESDRAFLNLNTFETLETMQMARAPHLLKKWCNLNPEGCFTFRLNSMWQGINSIRAYKRLHWFYHL